MEENNKNEFGYEENRLKTSKKIIDETLQSEKIKFHNLPKLYKSDPFLLASLMSITSTKIHNLRNSSSKPYFSRIDFKEDSKEKTEKIYIGKVGVMDLDGNVIVTDWRAPIATLYYDSNLGPVFYEAPAGIIKGKMSLKRQIMIEDGKLVNIFDVDSVSDDELLKPYLGANADSRLKNIVASIQSEQNDIIRKTLYKNSIVQGVAGSGKTTVALHRIAYLVYNYSEKVNADSFLVIGPNEFFINYISSVLPDLDVGNAKQLTFENLAREYIGERFEIINPTHKLINIISGESITEDLNFKMSMKYKRCIDRYIEKNQMLPNKDFEIFGFKVFPLDDIKLEYANEDFDKSIELKVETTIQRLSNNIKSNYEIFERLKSHYDLILKNIDKEDEKYNKIVNEYFKVKKILDGGAVKELKKYFNINNVKVLEQYKSFLNNLEKYIDEDEKIEKILEFKEKSISCINRKQVEFEDLPALMYLKYIISGPKDYKKYIHAVIDEAQDFGIFNFYVLKRILKKSTFSIFGDLTQGIYSYRAIKGWDEVRWECFDNKADIMYLEKSYRTTIEIMEEANNVSAYLGLGRGKPVIRRGEKVKYTKIDSKKSVAKYILKRIKELKDKGYISIAVICKTPEEASRMYEKLMNYISSEKINKDYEEVFKSISLINDDNKEYTGGICIIPSYLSKGLEFDSVIIENADETTYKSQNSTDMKLLYVAMTRALHELEIIYNDNRTKPLRNNIY